LSRKCINEYLTKLLPVYELEKNVKISPDIKEIVATAKAQRAPEADLGMFGQTGAPQKGAPQKDKFFCNMVTSQKY